MEKEHATQTVTDRAEQLELFIQVFMKAQERLFNILNG
jgi:chaperonin cofactor prefoldin